MITYRVIAHDAPAHLFRVEMRVTAPAPVLRLSLPAWIPGSYLIREFARHVSGLTATQQGRPVALRQIDKATWEAACDGSADTLVVGHLVYAFDTSVRAAFLDAGRGFFNGTSLCLRVEGREDETHRLELPDLPDGWDVATALAAADDADPGGDVPTFEAAGYAELVDHPVELGRFWRGRFEARGVPHEYVVVGALPDFDGERLLADTKRICEAEIDFWHGPSNGAERLAPFDRYVFMHNLVDEGHGGLEHRASTALISPRRDMPQRGRPETSDGYVNLLGLISHEYFHTWNVKRLRPSELARIDFTRENYTELLWFFEGFTSYYDDVFLLQTGLIDAPRYLKLIARTLGNVLALPGRFVQSVAQSSFDTWVKYYRTDENTPNATISYYTKGSLVALALDLTLRTEGRGTLDEVMRRLWTISRGGPVDEAQIAAALQHVGGRSYADELAAWVHGTDDLPLQPLLERFGIEWTAERATLAQRLGMRVSESALTGVKVGQVMRGGVAERAGVSAGDEILGVDGWRLRRLDDALRLMRDGAAAQWLVARDQRLLSLTLVMPAEAHPAASGIALRAQAKPAKAAAALRKAWLGD